MAANIAKGQTISLDSSVFNLSDVTIGLGWDMKKSGWGFLSHFFGKKKETFDLDVACFLLNEHNMVAHLGNEKLVGGDVIFFNNKRHSSGTVWLSGDDRTGEGEKNGDNEQIVVRLNSLAPHFRKIVFVVTIYDGIKKDQHFGALNKAFIRAMDATGKEMLRFYLSGKEYANKRTMLFAEVLRNNGHWEFKATGEGYDFDSFVHILQKYVPKPTQ